MVRIRVRLRDLNALFSILSSTVAPGIALGTANGDRPDETDDVGLSGVFGVRDVLDRTIKPVGVDGVDVRFEVSPCLELPGSSCLPPEVTPESAGTGTFSFGRDRMGTCLLALMVIASLSGPSFLGEMDDFGEGLEASGPLIAPVRAGVLTGVLTGVPSGIGVFSVSN